MKKFLSFLITFITIFSAFSIISFADNQVTDKPDIKLFINGSAITLNSSPIVMNGRTLLPLREILINLGVQNDDAHIKWNSTEKSININKDSNKITLKIDDYKVDVNGKLITIDVAPIIYKEKTYIPVRFIAESLNKKVAWQDETSSIFIQDEETYNKISTLLNDTLKVMQNLKNAKSHDNVKFSIFNDTINSSFEEDLNGVFDFENKIACGDMVFTKKFNDEKTNIKFYYENGHYYYKSPDSNGWVKADHSNDGDNNPFLYKTPDSNGWVKTEQSNDDIKNSFLSGIEINNILCSGLKYERDSFGNISLSGSVFTQYLKSLLDSEGIHNYKLDNCNFVIHIDVQNKDKHITMIYTTTSGKLLDTEGYPNFKIQSSELLTNFNSNPKANRPDGIE